MKNLSLVFFIGVLFCQCGKQESGTAAASVNVAESANSKANVTSNRTAIGSFEYWHHIKNEGPTPMPGQVVFYNFMLKKGGKVLQSNFGNSPIGGIMITEDEARNDPQALIEGLRLMAIGDSMTIIAPLEAHPDSNYIYEIVTRGIYSR